MTAHTLAALVLVFMTLLGWASVSALVFELTGEKYNKNLLLIFSGPAIIFIIALIIKTLF